MNIIFAILAMVASILLVLIVVVQNSKGGGLNSTFGASNLTNMVGNRRATQDIEKFTWYLIGAVMVVAFVANVTVSSGPIQSTESFGSILDGVPAASAPAPAPAPAGSVAPVDGGASEAQ